MRGSFIFEASANASSPAPKSSLTGWARVPSPLHRPRISSSPYGYVVGAFPMHARCHSSGVQSRFSADSQALLASTPEMYPCGTMPNAEMARTLFPATGSNGECGAVLPPGSTSTSPASYRSMQNPPTSVATKAIPRGHLTRGAGLRVSAEGAASRASVQKMANDATQKDRTTRWACTLRDTYLCSAEAARLRSPRRPAPARPPAALLRLEGKLDLGAARGRFAQPNFPPRGNIDDALGDPGERSVGADVLRLRDHSVGIDFEV